jgi:hypothetical protein
MADTHHQVPLRELPSADPAAMAAERQRAWGRFVQGVTYAIAATAVTLALLLVFVG